MLRLDGGLARQLMSRAPHLLVDGLVVLIAVLIAVRAATLLSQLAGQQTVPTASAGPPPRVTPRKNIDVPSILSANLFGQSARVGGDGEAPVTTMALTLGGVFAATDPKQGFAMIGSTPTDIKFYKVGARVPGGALLNAVYFDKVLLDRGGAVESLLMPPRIPNRAAPPAPSAATGGLTAPAGRVQQVMRENPGLLNQLMQRTPQVENGKLKGMKVYPVGNGQAFNKLGLKSGDLVTAINGVPLTDQTKAQEVFDSMGTQSVAQVTLLRDGAQQELRLNIAEVASEAERLAQQGPPANTGPGQPPGPESAR